ncbi:hypothetical protein JTE90_002702 [Oedothorax gibbosus]|uniref:Uncharacterized protein n=1 Tax=Oedothorax gibbosus TaxID=931172 RepID=A0AAV6VZ97_9ARAC|nr:hypothetical protein JTE90_002702 [Oedothorax gibbosus]
MEGGNERKTQAGGFATERKPGTPSTPALEPVLDKCRRRLSKARGAKAAPLFSCTDKFRSSHVINSPNPILGEEHTNVFKQHQQEKVVPCPAKKVMTSIYTPEPPIEMKCGRNRKI